MIIEMTIEIVNLKFYKGQHEYIGRPSVLGNPYSHLKTSIAKYKVDNVEAAISNYEIWLYDQIKSRNVDVVKELIRLSKIAKDGTLILGCWCVPFHDCHGKVIKNVIERMLKNDSNRSFISGPDPGNHGIPADQQLRTSDYLPSLYEDRRYADGVFQCAFALWLHDCNSAHIFEGMETSLPRAVRNHNRSVS